MCFLIYMYYTHLGYQISIFGKNCAYYIRIFTVHIILNCTEHAGQYTSILIRDDSMFM